MRPFGGQPIEPFGTEFGYAELHLSSEIQTRKLYMVILDYGDAVVVPTGARATRHLAYLGTEKQPYYSDELVGAMLGADTADIEYRVIGEEWRHATFQLGGLRTALESAPNCRWPF